MLAFSVLLTNYKFDDISKFNQEGSLLNPLAQFIEEEEKLFEAITWGTNGKWNIEKAFTSLEKFLNQNIIA